MLLTLELIRLCQRKSSWRVTYDLFKQNPSLLLDLLATGTGLMGMQSFLTWGATYTIMSHANLFSSLVSVIIVCYRLITFK
jgi:hypothetical protein